MQADMFNLFTAIGFVNALRSNYYFQRVLDEKSDFCSCEMINHKRKAQPPVQARGRINRAYLYIDQAYSKYSMSKQQRKLMSSWDNQHPIPEKECVRAEQIFKIQGNINQIVTTRCKAQYMPPLLNILVALGGGFKPAIRPRLG